MPKVYLFTLCKPSLITPRTLLIIDDPVMVKALYKTLSHCRQKSIKPCEGKNFTVAIFSPFCFPERKHARIGYRFDYNVSTFSGRLFFQFWPRGVRS